MSPRDTSFLKPQELYTILENINENEDEEEQQSNHDDEEEEQQSYHDDEEEEQQSYHDDEEESSATVFEGELHQLEELTDDEEDLTRYIGERWEAWGVGQQLTTPTTSNPYIYVVILRIRRELFPRNDNTESSDESD